ncbi:MAG: tetratricopeptide repeat protein [Ferruginibacter sp.]
MSKKKKLITKTEIEAKPAENLKEHPQLLPAWSFKSMALVVFAFAVGLYVNTITHEYALDDGIVITENAFTKQGFSGIPDILSHESFANVATSKDELSGGRYRPLSVVTFAMEYGIFGARPSVSHLVNVLLYGFLCVLLFYFLKQAIFKHNTSAAFIATLIFAAHPLHTDVVSNIKGRDELLSLLLLLVCLIFYQAYFERKKFSLLVVSLAAYFFSLLAKENGITFIAVIPLIIYFFNNKKLKESISAAFPFIFVFAFYFLIRLKITGLPSGGTKEVMNAPFVLASGADAVATKIMIMGKDLLMLVFPHPLSYDYSYNQIPYVSFTDWKCILSILLNGILVFFAIRLFKKRHLLSFAILFYFITISIVSNLVFDVGSPFNERFLFQPSIGFAIAVAFILNYLGTRRQESSFYKGIAVSLSMIIILAGGIMTILRNPDWKNNETLFAADVLHAPNSAKTQTYQGVGLLNKGTLETDSIKKNRYFDMAIPYFNRALKIHPGFADPNIDLGNIYAQQGKLDSAKKCLLEAKAIYSDIPALNTNLLYLSQQYDLAATKYFAQNNVAKAIEYVNASLECNPGNVNGLYNLGGYYLNLREVEKAREVWTRALALDPGNSTIKYWLNRISVPQAQGPIK